MWYNSGMETISRNITDLAADERVAIEQFLGKHLADNQRIIVQVMDVDAEGVQTPQRSIEDYAILADLDDATTEIFDEAIQRSPSRYQPTP